MRWQFPPNPDPTSFSSLAVEFLLYAEVEFRFSRESTQKYGECLKQIWFALGDRAPASFTRNDVLALKRRWLDKGLSASRQTSLLLSLRRFLLFCRELKKVHLALDPDEIKPPPRPRREVIFLTPDEIEEFVATIPLRTWNGEV